MIYFLLSFIFPLVWTFYFLKKDKHPEPFRWLAFAFILGIVAAFLSYLVEDIIVNLVQNKLVFYIFASFIEEFFKFFVIWSFIFPTRVFDEPIDAMIYMIVSAFGFSSIENFFYLQTNDGSKFWILFFRFLGANFLHILASALIGYGYGYFKKTQRFLPLVISFLGAVFLHFLYNFVIISIKFTGFILILPALWSVFLVVLSELEYLSLINDQRGTKTTS